MLAFDFEFEIEGDGSHMVESWDLFAFEFSFHDCYLIDLFALIDTLIILRFPIGHLTVNYVELSIYLRFVRLCY